MDLESPLGETRGFGFLIKCIAVVTLAGGEEYQHEEI